MAVLYKAVKANIANKEGKKLYHPQVVLTGNVTLNQIAKQIAEISSLTAGDVKNTLNNMITVVAQHLQASESVTLDGFGTFRMVMTSAGNGVESADDVSASQASLTVRFSPASTKNLDRTIATRSLVTGSKCVRFDKITTITAPSTEDTDDSGSVSSGASGNGSVGGSTQGGDDEADGTEIV